MTSALTLPEGLRTQVRLLSAFEDARGCLFEPLDAEELGAQKNVHVVMTQPGAVRGNHVHRGAVETTIVVGPCLVRFKEDGVQHDVEVPAGAVCRFVFPADVIHAFQNTGSSVMTLVSFSTALHDATGAGTQRESLI